MTKARFWNVWWTFTMISAALTVALLLLEVFGVLHDVGMALSLLGLVISVLFGLTASTRSSLNQFRGVVVPRLDVLAAGVDGLGSRLDGLGARFDGLGARFDGLDARLDRIIALLDERLPRPAA